MLFKQFDRVDTQEKNEHNPQTNDHIQNDVEHPSNLLYIMYISALRPLHIVFSFLSWVVYDEDAGIGWGRAFFVLKLLWKSYAGRWGIP